MDRLIQDRTFLHLIALNLQRIPLRVLLDSKGLKTVDNLILNYAIIYS